MYFYLFINKLITYFKSSSKNRKVNSKHVLKVSVGGNVNVTGVLGSKSS